MLNKWVFGRQISMRPLITSLVVGAAFMLVMLPFFSKIGLQYVLVVGIVAFLLVSMLYFPQYLVLQYGFWQVTSQGIHYYRYNSWSDRVRAIFNPHATPQELLRFDQIKSVSVVVGHKIIESREIIGAPLMAYAPEFYLPWMRTARYLNLKLKNGEEVRLDLSWDYRKHDKSQDYLADMVSYIESNLA
ncbi:hypothetical protein ACFP1L_09330 [Lactiplantibacillus nangangensis]|uniref:DUF2982 domain-containing protein n=1 Tax=Lactiplantibacillus nangangensis TaxID=2559917 RepID=A0ABW1SKH2_9LACO|nr:hypothetical protein [Lactiplantibacillus nangangensis]